MRSNPRTLLRIPPTGDAGGTGGRRLGWESGVDTLVKRRLSTVAFLYAACYVAALGYALVQMALEHGRILYATSSLVVSAVAVLLALVVGVCARRGRLPVARLWTLALVFEVTGAVGIIGGAWGWEQEADRHYYATYRALESVFETGEPLPGDRLAGLATETPSPLSREAFHHRFIDPLVAMNHRLLSHDGVPWIGVWILIFPLVLPASPRRILVSSFAAATAPLIFLLASPALHGVPYSIEAWIVPFTAEFFVPVYICAGIAYFAARTVYGLHENLSKARRLGSYELVERIGEGSMGEVWRARHDLLMRPAAIKLIKLDARSEWDHEATRAAMARFEREAQATAALGSPHSVELYDFGVTNEGIFYYVMELLDGLDLRTLVERDGPQPPERVVHLMRQACHSLWDAHRSGLVHRDVKPANIFACRRGHELDFVKVLDFGLVKETHPDGDVQLTSEGAMCGTPAFMAPEVAAGKAPDARADIYALGCVMYWLLTGRLVFDGPTPVAVLAQHMRSAPEPPSRTVAHLPASLDQVVLACLAKDPDERPESAAALVRSLDGVASALTPWTPARAEAWWAKANGAPGGAPREARPESDATVPAGP